MNDPKQLIAQVEHAWRTKKRAPGVPPLTRLHVHIAAKLAYWQSPNVKQRALAIAARCSVRTVQRALARLHALGLLSWTRRVLACRGWRAQIANVYQFLSLKHLDFLVLRSTARLSPPGMKMAPRPAPAGQLDLLAARRSAMEGRMAR